MNFQTIRQAAKKLDMTERQLRYAIQQGKIKGLKIGNRCLIDLDDAAVKLKNIDKMANMEDVVLATGLTYSAIRRGIQDGWIPCRKNGKSYEFDMDAVKDAIRNRMAQK